MDGLEETSYPDGLDRTRPVGTRFVQRIREGGRVSEYQGIVTAYDPQRHLGIEIGNRAPREPGQGERARGGPQAADLAQPRAARKPGPL